MIEGEREAVAWCSSRGRKVTEKEAVALCNRGRRTGTVKDCRHGVVVKVE